MKYGNQQNKAVSCQNLIRFESIGTEVTSTSTYSLGVALGSKMIVTILGLTKKEK